MTLVTTVPTLALLEPTPEAAAILVVDDDVVILDALCAQLACEGYEVTACAGAGDALTAMRSKKFAVVLTDQNMPEMKGLEFLTLARALQPSAARLLITGILSAGTLVEAINHGEIFRFLAKPWARAELLGCVRSAVQHHELHAANESLREEVEKLRTELHTSQSALQAAQRLIPESIHDIKANPPLPHSTEPLHAMPARHHEPERDHSLTAYC